MYVVISRANNVARVVALCLFQAVVFVVIISPERCRVKNSNRSFIEYMLLTVITTVPYLLTKGQTAP
jgi:hypothetical protein